ncbi:class I SAM-dependent methyltransferase [Mycolicibacterium arenosum]|uniref:Methyltransferase domain-containing protein n=1 Tax=Mycolicibacterium arenosum TaxID=2952157 RepID=A0ABT1MFM7_9MYCO|nr:class I SAM-dependent methyltransferase [Mycolicibacterium sp. CAU 1645]MCP9276567.1 methyltransferase domain-containing protein [Mycolicibacterium sp. CAU 1645]
MANKYELTISFDQVAHLYDETRGLPPDVSEQVTEAIVRITGAGSGTRFFEHGIGTGRMALPLIARGFDVTGVDISTKMLDTLRRQLDPEAAAKLHLREADVRELPYADASFDVGISALLLHLVPEWRLALRELIRVLKPGGYLCYAHQKPADAAPSTIVDERWVQINAGLGLDITSPGATVSQVIDELAAQHISVEQHRISAWDHPVTVAGLLQRYRRRTHSPDWRTPDDVHAQAVAELSAWATTTYLDHHESMSNPIAFDIITARIPKTSEI